MKLCNPVKFLTGLLASIALIIVTVSISWAIAQKTPVKKSVKPVKKNNTPVVYTEYNKNAELIKSFIKIRVPRQSVLDSSKIPSGTPATAFLKTLKALNEASKALKNRQKPKGMPRVLRKKLPAGVPLHNRYNLLKLNYLFRMKKYKEFIKLYDSTGTSSLRIKYLYAQIRTGNNKKSFKIFKELFKTRTIKQFSPWVTGKRLKRYLSSLSYEYWFSKFNHLISRGRYYEFRRESRYSRSPQLTSLFTAEYNYRKKRYQKARYYLRRVKAKHLLPHKSKLLIKLDLRQKKSGNFLKRIEMLSAHKNIYNQLLYDAGSISLINDDLKGATKAFNRFMVKVPETDHRYSKIVWLNAWVQIRLDNTPAAILLFGKCSKLPDRKYYKASTYWGRTLAKREGTSIKDPFNYYYVIEHSKPDPSVMAAHTEGFRKLLNSPVSDTTRKSLELTKHLLKSGELKTAVNVLTREINKKSTGKTDKSLMVLVKSVILAKDKNYFDSYVSFRKGIKSYQEFVLPNWLKLITMPDEYVTTVLKYAGVYKVDPLLVMALIRQESLFNPRTRSHANAYGLMQLLPRTARQMAGRKRRLKRYHLYRPDINIRYGIKYLSFLLKKYDNRIHLALAAYNAGDHRVDKWLPEIGSYSKEMMVELIPFSETRNYVKNITRNYFYYKHYYPELSGTAR